MNSILKISFLLLSSNALAYSDITLQSKTLDVLDAYSWTCTGAPCYTVWKNQIEKIEELNSYIDEFFSEETKPSKKTGKTAKETSDTICSSSATGNRDWMIALSNAENSVLRRLEAVQQQAKVSVSTCQKTVE